MFPIIINYNGGTKIFYLRKQNSINALNTIVRQIEFYTRLFTVKSGLDESNGNSEKWISDIKSSRSYNINLEGKTISFLTAGQQSDVFSCQDIKTLLQIEQMTGYIVKPRGIVSQYKHGGIFVIEKSNAYRFGAVLKNSSSNEVLLPGEIAQKAGMKAGDKIISINDNRVVDGNITEIINKTENKGKLCKFKINRNGDLITLDIFPIAVEGYGLVAAIRDLGSMDWNSAKNACDELVLNGYSDWHLPTKDELNVLYVKLKQFGVGGFANDTYWSSTGSWKNDNACGQQFNVGEQNCDNYNKEEKHFVRAVRTF